MITKKILVLFFALLLCKIVCTAQKSVFLSLSLDPKMLITGPYDTSKQGALNYVFRLGATGETHEYGLSLENFSEIGYFSYSAFYNYKNPFGIAVENFSFLIGAEVGRLIRKVEDYRGVTFAVNAETRYHFNKNWGVLLAATYRYRCDLVEVYQENNCYKFNGYTGVFFNW